MSRASDAVRTVAEAAGLAWDEASLWAMGVWRRAAGLREALAAQAERTRRSPLAWGTLYVAIFCLLSITLIDRPLALWLKAHVHGDVQGFFRVVTNLGRAEFYLVPAGLAWLAAVLRGRRTPDPARRRRLREWSWRPAFLFLAIAVSGILGTLVKVAAGRARPRMLFDQGIYGLHPFTHDWAMNSFPSGHSQAAWAAMTALVVLVPRYDLLWLLIAVLVAASRVALTVHYLGDVVAGSWLGLSVTILLARMLGRRGHSIHSPL